MTELKDCPFCGGEAAIGDCQQGTYIFYWVVCTKCQGKNGGTCKKDEAVTAWNRRVKVL